MVVATDTVFSFKKPRTKFVKKPAYAGVFFIIPSLRGFLTRQVRLFEEITPSWSLQQMPFFHSKSREQSSSKSLLTQVFNHKFFIFPSLRVFLTPAGAAF